MKKRLIAALLAAALVLPANNAHVRVAASSANIPKSQSQIMQQHQEGYTKPPKLLNKTNLWYLSRIIQHEAGNTADWLTSYMVGVVVLKRKKSDLFPDTIKEVLLQDNPRQYMSYYEFTQTKPNKRSRKIAKDLLTYGMKGISKYPDSLLYHANFRQGSGTYMYSEGIYFCLQ